MGEKKWKSAWVVTDPEKHSLYDTKRYYWKPKEKLFFLNNEKKFAVVTYLEPLSKIKAVKYLS